MRIDVRGSAELRDIVLAINQSGREVQRVLRQYAKAALTGPWLEAMNERASTIPERRVLAATATVTVSNQNVRITSAAKGRRLSGGLNPKTDYAAFEYGGERGKKSTYTRKGHRVTRRTQAQLRPRNRRGYVFGPANREMVPRLAAMWVQSIVKTYALIFEGRG